MKNTEKKILLTMSKDLFERLATHAERGRLSVNSLTRALIGSALDLIETPGVTPIEIKILRNREKEYVTPGESDETTATEIINSLNLEMTDVGMRITRLEKQIEELKNSKNNE